MKEYPIDGEESTNYGSHVAVVAIQGGSDPKPVAVKKNEPAQVAGFYGTLEMGSDGKYEYHLNDELKPSPRSLYDTFVYVLSDGTEQAEEELRFRVRPMRGFEWVSHEVVENQKPWRELKARVALAAGVSPDQIGRCEEWESVYMADLPEGNRFISKKAVA